MQILLLRVGGTINKVRGARFNVKLRSHFFLTEGVDIWNELPEEVVEAGTIIHLISKGASDYGAKAGEWG